MIEKYFEEELRYLYDSGKEFAKAHPDRAQFLNIDSVGDRDPYVERLFEGFAFLTGRIREKLHDSFPQLTEGIINLLWPQLLHEIPSTAIVEFSPRTGFLQEKKILPRGSEVLSRRVGQYQTVCRFITTQDVELAPVSLTAIEKQANTKGNEILSFHFKIDPNISWNDVSLKKLCLFIHAEIPTALMLHDCLTTSVIDAKVTMNNGETSIPIPPDRAITPGGLTHETSLLPGDQRSFWGYSLLREFFIYPEKFLFINLHGFDSIPFLDNPPVSITYTVTLSKIFPSDKPFSVDNFKLYCTPIVNLSHYETEPVIRNGLKSEYRILVDASAPDVVFAHNITAVTGINRITGERSEYVPMYTFQNITNPGVRSYATRFKRTPAGKRELYLVVGGDQISDENMLTEENLSVKAWCSNGELPRDTINEGDIRNPGKGFPDYIRISNITRPSLPFAPPEDSNFLWMFQSHLSTTWASLASAETMKCFLKIYDWSKQEGRVRRIEAINSVNSNPAEMIIDSCIVRGVSLEVEIREAEFKDSGDIHLFGLILSEFLSQFISINSFIELVFVLKPSGNTMRWNPAKGKRCLI